MQKYDIIFLGKSSFTEDLLNHFQSHVNTIIIDNDSIPVNFSLDFFPKVTFIPSDKEVDSSYGYIVSNSYRFELNPNINISKIFFTECFRNIDGLSEKLILESSLQITFLNQIIMDNFEKSPYKWIFKNFFKYPKDISRIVKKIEIKDVEFNQFVDALCIFFAPGEYNNQFYRKYLLFSLLSKKPYKILPNELKTKQIVEKEKLREIRNSEKGFELIFDNIKLEGKFLVSTIPPHILNLGNVKHPFDNQLQEIFYNVSFDDNVILPSYLPEELVYFDNKDFWFITIKNNKLNLYKKSSLNKRPGKDEIFHILSIIFPHIDPLPEYIVKPHIFIDNQPKNKKKLNLNKNFFFTKNFEFPYYGSDGEILYRNIIKENIWKKLL